MRVSHAGRIERITPPPAIAGVLVLATALLSFLDMARADSADEPVRLSYVVPASCPDETDFLERVRRRTTRLRAAGEGELARQFTITISGVAPSRGQLSIVSLDGKRGVRVVRGGSCEEVADALALAAALAIDPDAIFRSKTSTPIPSALPSEAPPTIVETPRQVAARAWHVSLGISGDASTLVGPSPALGGSLFVDSEVEIAPTFLPSVRIGTSYLTAWPTEAGAGMARFQRPSTSLEACPTRLIFGPFSTGACVRGDLGALRGQGYEVATPKASTPVWFALGPSARIRLQAQRSLFLELEGAPMFPVARPRFFFEPNTQAYVSPDVGIEASFSLGVDLR